MVFSWDFGDGAMGAGGAPSHAYMNTGSLRQVTATDGRNISDKA